MVMRRHGHGRFVAAFRNVACGERAWVEASLTVFGRFVSVIRLSHETDAYLAEAYRDRGPTS
jgi:hypothetical protein